MEKKKEEKADKEEERPAEVAGRQLEDSLPLSEKSQESGAPRASWGCQKTWNPKQVFSSVPVTLRIRQDTLNGIVRAAWVKMGHA